MKVVMEPNALDAVFGELLDRGFTLVGPTVRDGVIVYDRISCAADLPAGWTDEQAGGAYRLARRGDGAQFGYAVGPHSWKKYLLPPRLTLWTAERSADGFVVNEPEHAPDRLALIGVRACELQALAVQDRVLAGGEHVDSYYRSQRNALFVLAVHCGAPAATCFCTSMGTGPRAAGGFDLALTEVIDGEQRYFVAEYGTEAGRQVLSTVPGARATPRHAEAADAVVRRAEGAIRKRLDTADIKRRLLDGWDHPRWDNVAERCLACGNCTMVCPTCFCTTTEDVPNLSGSVSDHVRTWDSCFTLDFSYVRGPGSLRTTHKARYRQWLTHKLATWIDQFGTSGCVGCGRCITWCPVGIDLTEEANAIRGSGDGAG